MEKKRKNTIRKERTVKGKQNRKERTVKRKQNRKERTVK
jgi:hypothetical protein